MRRRDDEVVRAPYTVAVETGGIARDHCAAMLEALGWAVDRTPGAPEPHPDLVWAGSGAMALTGCTSGPPLLAPGPLASAARGAMQALRFLAGDARRLDGIDGARLLGERAACLGLRRRGAIAPGGACRLVHATDGWVAVNLARPSDVELLPAWLALTDRVTDSRDGAETWAAVRAAIAGRCVADVVERARLLGLPAAPAAAPSLQPRWYRRAVDGGPRARSADAVPLVIDLSALWAGPLAASLLGAAGARVIKVESTRRPDGARRGSQSFYDLMNSGKESVSLDLSSSEGKAALRALIVRADIVLESARPRALRQLGIDAAELVRSVPGLVWVGVSGYGRGEPEATWVAFGDDAAVAAGLAEATGRLAGSEKPLFCGDAIADPLTGIHAAVAAMSAWRMGRGCLLDLALHDVTAYVAGIDSTCGGATVEHSVAGGGWQVVSGAESASVNAPAARVCARPSRALGADTAAVLAEFAIPFSG